MLMTISCLMIAIIAFRLGYYSGWHNGHYDGVSNASQMIYPGRSQSVDDLRRLIQ